MLTVVAFIATALTSLKIGPVWGLGDRYGLPDELVIGYLQLFLLDCGLILLPLSVSVSQQRLSADRAAAGRELLDGLVASASGTAIIATDRSGRIVLFNPGAEAMLGRSAEEALGEVPDRFLPPDELTPRASSQLPNARCSVASTGTVDASSC